MAYEWTLGQRISSCKRGSRVIVTGLQLGMICTLRHNTSILEWLMFVFLYWFYSFCFHLFILCLVFSVRWRARCKWGGYDNVCCGCINMEWNRKGRIAGQFLIWFFFSVPGSGSGSFNTWNWFSFFCIVTQQDPTTSNLNNRQFRAPLTQHNGKQIIWLRKKFCFGSLIIFYKGSQVIIYNVTSISFQVCRIII